LNYIIFDLCFVLIWGKVWICVLSDWVSVLNSPKPFEIKKTLKERCPISQLHMINFSQIVVSYTPLGVITVPLGARPLTWCRYTPFLPFLDCQALEVNGFQGLGAC